jgi:hypothetical protein
MRTTCLSRRPVDGATVTVGRAAGVEDVDATVELDDGEADGLGTVGVRTTFEVLLPHPLSTTATSTAAASAKHLRGVNLLIVDSSPPGDP